MEITKDQLYILKRQEVRFDGSKFTGHAQDAYCVSDPYLPPGTDEYWVKVRVNSSIECCRVSELSPFKLTEEYRPLFDHKEGLVRGTRVFWGDQMEVVEIVDYKIVPNSSGSSKLVCLVYAQNDEKTVSGTLDKFKSLSSIDKDIIIVNFNENQRNSSNFSSFTDPLMWYLQKRLGFSPRFGSIHPYL